MKKFRIQVAQAVADEILEIAKTVKRESKFIIPEKVSLTLSAFSETETDADTFVSYYLMTAAQAKGVMDLVGGLYCAMKLAVEKYGASQQSLKACERLVYHAEDIERQALKQRYQVNPVEE